MDLIHDGDDEPVYELGDEQADDATEAPPERRGLQLDTLFTPQALAMAGTALALLAALGPFTSYFNVLSPLVQFGQFGGDFPAKGWILGPQLGLAAAGVALGLTSWRMALMTDREVPRLAGVAVVIGAAILVMLGVIWTYEIPALPEEIGG